MKKLAPVKFPMIRLNKFCKKLSRKSTKKDRDLGFEGVKNTISSRSSIL